MSLSILDTVKKVVGLSSSDMSFDDVIIMHTNSAFSTLTQLGIGPEDGFEIEDSIPTWDSFIPEKPKFNFIKSYVYLRVRLLFDPPQTSFTIDAMNNQLEEFEWRINVLREGESWVPSL